MDPDSSFKIKTISSVLFPSAEMQNFKVEAR